ncbi:MAG: hypothetical protein IKK95_08050, partial [Lachnospiraceae bacterium]|nr:hypothetical protein [Lachnospiraceae bacterium]
MAGNRPRGRQRNVSGSGKSVYKRGSGLGTGPVGSSGGYSGRPSGGGIGGGSSRGSRGPRNTRGGGGLGKLILLGLIVLFGGGGGLGSMNRNIAMKRPSSLGFFSMYPHIRYAVVLE